MKIVFDASATVDCLLPDGREEYLLLMKKTGQSTRLCGMRNA